MSDPHLAALADPTWQALVAKRDRLRAARAALDDEIMSPNARRAKEADLARRLTIVEAGMFAANITSNADRRIAWFEPWAEVLQKADGILDAQERVARAAYDAIEPKVRWVNASGAVLGDAEVEEHERSNLPVYERPTAEAIAAEAKVAEIQDARTALRYGGSADARWLPIDAMREAGAEALDGHADLWSGRLPLAHAKARLADERRLRAEHWTRVEEALAVSEPEPSPAAVLRTVET